MEVKKKMADKGTIIPSSSKLVLDRKMSWCERSLWDLWKKQEELIVQLVKGNANCLQKFILCKQKIMELQAVIALYKGKSESAKIIWNADEEECDIKRIKGRAYERKQFDGKCFNYRKTDHKKKDC